MERGFGYLPDPEDERDLPFGAQRQVGVPRANEVRFDHLVSHVRDQGRTNSCVGQAVCTAIEVRRALDGKPPVRLSALGLYWPARTWARLQEVDGGAYIRDAMKTAHRLGVPSEAAWPFREDKVNARPVIPAEQDGLTRADGNYERMTGAGTVRVESVLDAVQARCPGVFGTDITDALRRSRSGETVPPPKPGEPRYGGHAMAIMGMDRGGERVLIVNSWSKGYGFGGFAWLAAEWFADPFTRDAWALRSDVAEVPRA